MVTHNDSEVELTEEEFNEIISNGHKLVVVDFFAEWCMPCVIMSPIIEELAESITMKEVKFVKMNADDNPRLSQKYKISSIPCLVIFKKGKEVGRIVGGQAKEVLEEKIKGFL